MGNCESKCKILKCQEPMSSRYTNYPLTRVESHIQPVENKGGVAFTNFRGPQALVDNLPNYQIFHASAVTSGNLSLLLARALLSRSSTSASSAFLAIASSVTSR